MERELSIKKGNHTLGVTIYDKLVKVSVYLSSDLYFDVVIRSQTKPGVNPYDYERFVLNDFKMHVFNEKHPAIVHFTYADEMYEYMKSNGIDVERGNNNGWYNSLCFEMSSVNTEQSILQYIEKKSSEFSTKSYQIP